MQLVPETMSWVNALLFTSSADLTFTGSNDKDVNVNFTGGSGDDTSLPAK